MAETVKVAGEFRVLTQTELKGLARVAVAINAADTSDYLFGMSKVHPSIIEKIDILKVPRIAQVRHVGSDHTVSTPAEVLTSTIVKTKTLKNLWIDTKFGEDGKELIASIDGLRDSTRGYAEMINSRAVKYTPRRKLSESKTRNIFDKFDDREAALEHATRLSSVLPPSYLSILVTNQSEPEELRVAVEHCEDTFIPIAIVSTSKQKPETPVTYGFDHESITASMANLAYDSGFRYFQAAVSDAELVRNVLSDRGAGFDDIIIHGTGAVLTSDDIGEHDLSAQIFEVNPFVNVFVLGKAVLLHANPDIHLLEYADAIGAV